MNSNLDKKIINVYGCSWTQGVDSLNDCKSWPYYLSLMIPDNYEIHSYAISGSSLDYSAFQLHRYKNFADINIFQVTVSGRISVFNKELFNTNNLVETYPKLREFDFNYGQENFTLYNSAKMQDLDRWERTFFQKYIEMFEIKTETLDTIRYNHLYYALNNCNFVFGHIYDHTLRALKIKSIDRCLEKSKFQSYSKDIGYHFDETGSQIVAQIVYDNISKDIV